MTDEKTIHKKKLRTSGRGKLQILPGLSPPIMSDIFELRGNICNLKIVQSLYSTSKKSVRFETKKVTYRGNQIWNLIPVNFNNVSSLKNFKKEIKKWQGEKYPCKIRKTYLQSSGFF